MVETKMKYSAIFIAIWVVMVDDIDQAKSEELKCTIANERCELPFFYEGKRYEACTGEWVESKRPWCPSKVYSNGSADLSYCMKCWGDQRCYFKADSFPDSSWILSCPTGCHYVQKNVYGSNNEFSADSYICAAAIHRGLLTNETGGDVVFVKRPWRKAFVGDEKNGIQTYKATKEGVQMMNFRESFKVAPSPFMIFTHDQTKISQLAVGSVSETTIVDSQRFATGIASDVRRRKIFWTDVGRRSIISAVMEKSISNQKVIIKGEQVLKPEVLAFDWIHSNLYWSDLGFHSVSMSDDDGRNIRTLIKRGEDFRPRGLAVDPKNGYYYVADFGKNPKIEKCFMSREECDTIIDSQIQIPTGLALDIDGDQMCWADSEIPLVSCTSLDGSRRRNMKFSKERLKQPFAIAMYEERVYWTDWLMTTLGSVNYKTWDDFHIHLGDLTKGGGITIYADSAQKLYKNYCDGSPCEHLCVPEKDGFQCLCADNYFLQDDQSSCGAAPPTAPPPGSRLDVYVADYVHLKRFNVNLNTWKSDSTTLLRGLRRATAVSLDTQKNMIYWSDAVSNKIEMAPLSNDLSRAGRKTFLDGKSGYSLKVEGIAIDSITRLFYWTDIELHAVFVSNLDPVGGEHYVGVLVNGSDSYKPKGIALDPRRGYLYIVDSGNPVKIQKCESSGDPTCRSIVESGLNRPNWIAIDFETDRLYYTGQKMIQYCDLEGKNKKDLPSTLSPYGIGIFKNKVYWNDWSGRSIMSMDKTTGQDKHTITSTLIRPMGMFLHDPLEDKGPYSVAAYQNTCAGNKCEYLCVPTPNRRGKRYTCICPEKFKGTPVADECEVEIPLPVICKKGYQLLPDRKTCGDIPECIVKKDGCQHKCRNTIGSFFCECNQGYQLQPNGKTCKKIVAVVKDPCSSNPCENGGVCRKNGNDDFTCYCSAGFSGPTCKTRPVVVEDPCSSSPCGNGGACRKNANNFVCYCRPGFTGSKCENVFAVVKEPCAINPCKNGGVCQKRGNEFTCLCKAGFMGSTCNTPTVAADDPCSINPCKNGGNCQKKDDEGFVCFCANGFKGSTCETLDIRLLKSIDSTDAVRLQCIAPPDVKSEIIWSLDRRQIDRVSAWAQIKSDGRQLVINSPHFTYSGNYTCQYQYLGIERVAKLTVIIDVEPKFACGLSPGLDIPERRHGPKVLGGRESQLLMAPFMAMLHMKSKVSEINVGAFCGGSLVDTKHVVTAAHCFAKASYKHVRVYVGKLDARVSVIERLQQSSDIEKVIIHPEHIPHTLHADIAIIVLKTKVYFSAGVKPICIAAPNDKAEDVKSRPYSDKRKKKLGIVYGWGLTQSGDPSRRLLEIDLPIVSQKKCKETYPGEITDLMFCVGGEENRDACEGDSGGPFTLWSKKKNRWFLGGLVSWGIQCGRSNKPGVYTRIGTKMRKWIHGIANI